MAEIFQGHATTSAGGSGSINTTPLPYSNQNFTGIDGSGSNGSGVGSALASAGGSLVSSLINNVAEDVRSKKQREWNEEMMDKQNAWNLEMWNKQNEYNSETAQVARMREAGLNPIFGNTAPSNATELTSAQAQAYQRASMPIMGNPVQDYLDAKLKNAQIENVQSNTSKINNETLTETQRRENMKAELDNVKQELLNKKANEKLTGKQIERIDKDLQWIDRLNEANIAKAEADAALSNSQKKRIETLLEGEKILQSKSIEDFEYKWAKIRSEIAKMAAETGLLAKDIENYALNHASNGFMGTGVSIQNLFRVLGDTKKDTQGMNQGAPKGADYQNVNYPSSGVK